MLAALRAASAQSAQLQAGARAADVAAADPAVAAAYVDLKKAQDFYDKIHEVGGTPEEQARARLNAAQGAYTAAQQRLDLWVPFARITCPILVIRGAESDILSERTATQMRTTHTDVTVVAVPGVGHAPSLVEPEAIAALRKFLLL